MADGTCAVDGCGRRSQYRGWCDTHYARWRRHGTTADRPRPQRSTCTVAECTNFVVSHGRCAKHHKRWQKYGTTELPVRSKRTCVIDQCPALEIARGWCRKHYQRWKKTGDPVGLIIIRGDDVARFWSKVAGDAGMDCWEWQGARKPAGYGQFYTAGKLRPAHRVAYELLRGEIGTDHLGRRLVLDHECRNPPCVNPWHLDPVTIAENVRRGTLTTECLRGHLRTADNTYYDPSGKRSCRDCKRTRRAA